MRYHACLHCPFGYLSRMDLVPVIDISSGIAVHARRGHRDTYQALHTPYAPGPDPAAVTRGLIDAFAPRQVYFADLDAIARRPGNGAVIRDLARQFGGRRMLVDAGFRSADAIEPFLDVPNVDIVIATEVLSSLDAYRALAATVPQARLLLSLDRRGGEMLGCADLFERAGLWPARIIHMNLDRVGSGDGPDWDGLAQLAALAPDRALYAAGGVRDADDLEELASQGIAAVLIGSALHDGRIDPAVAARYGHG